MAIHRTYGCIGLNFFLEKDEAEIEWFQGLRPTHTDRLDKSEWREQLPQIILRAKVRKVTHENLLRGSHLARRTAIAARGWRGHPIRSSRDDRQNPRRQQFQVPRLVPQSACVGSTTLNGSSTDLRRSDQDNDAVTSIGPKCHPPLHTHHGQKLKLWPKALNTQSCSNDATSAAPKNGLLVAVEAASFWIVVDARHVAEIRANSNTIDSIGWILEYYPSLPLSRE